MRQHPWSGTGPTPQAPHSAVTGGAWKGLLLQPPHPFTTDTEDVPNFLERLRLVCVQPVAQPHNKCLAFGEVAEAERHAAAYLGFCHEHIGLRVWVSSMTSWSAAPSSVKGCCNWARGWTAIRSSSTWWGVQPRAALRAREWTRPWLAHSWVAAARSRPHA